VSRAITRKRARRGAPARELRLASQRLAKAVRRSREAAKVDSFSGWMLTAFGAALALLLANIQTVSTFIRVEDLRRSAFVFLVAILVGVLQKSLASFVASTSAAALEGEALGRDIASAGARVDMQIIFGELERATLFPFRWIVRRALRKVANGDLAVGGRMCIMLSQLQGWAVSLESALALAAALIFVRGLAV